MDAARLHDAFLEQAGWLAQAGANAIVLETMYTLKEALIALRAAKAAGLPVVACMTYSNGKDSDRTTCGQTPEKVTEALIEAGADAVGANCGFGARQMIPLCKRIKSVSSVPIWIKPNAGLPNLLEGRAIYSLGPHEFVRDAMSLADAGANFVGGCCGTGPEHIRELAAKLRFFRQDEQD
jgi:methionine synthase I (cobalamin-dependent)